MPLYTAILGDEEHAVAMEPREDGRFTLSVRLPSGREIKEIVDVRSLGGMNYSVLVNRRMQSVSVTGTAPALAVHTGNGAFLLELFDARRRALAAKTVTKDAKKGPLVVRTPMPGKVIRVLVKVGDAVTQGHPLVIVEAMKMENELRATRDGEVAKIYAEEGQALESGEALLELR